MAVILNDTFTGTGTLQAHTPDAGGAWSAHASYSGSAMALTGTRCRLAATATDSLYTNAVTPASADYTVSADIVPVAARVGFLYPAVCARVSTAAKTHYKAQVNWDTSGLIHLYKTVAGSATDLGTFSFTPTAGVPFNLSLEVSGSSTTTLTVKKDGVTIIGPIDDTSSPITAAGKAGLQNYADNASDVADAAGAQFDNVQLADSSTSPTSYTLTPSTMAGRPSVASSNFTLTLNANAASTVTFTLSDGGASGTFTPSSPQITAGNSTVTFTYTAASTGAKTISVSDDAGLTDPSSVTFTAYSLSLTPGSQTVGISTAATLTATLTPSGALAASTTAGTLSTTTPTSGSGFTLTDSVAQTDTVTVTGLGGTSQTATVTYTNSPAVSPSTATIDQGATQALTASNFTGSTVTWSSSNTSAATVNASTGVVTGVAHGQATSQAATITATGVSNPAQTATATITVRAVAISAVSPSSATVGIGLTEQFTATVTGSTNTTVTWSVFSGTGSVDSAGLYTAPGSAGSDTVRATAAADTARHSDATVTITTAYTAQTSAGVFAAGLSTVGFAVYARSGSTWAAYQARTTSGVAEIGSGTGCYGATFSAAYDTEYQVVWDDGGGPATYASPDRVYRPTAPPTAAAIRAEIDSNSTKLDATITSRMASYTQPTGFLAATFPTTVASPTNITAGTITTVTTLTNLPTAPTDWLTAAAVKADAVTKIQSGLSTYAGGDTSGTTTLLSRLSSTRAGYLDNLSGGAVAMAATALSTAVWTNAKAGYLDAAVSSVSTGGVSAGDIATAVAAQITTDHGSGSYVRNTEPPDVSGLATATSLAAVKTDTAAIKLKTDNLPASPAAVGSAMTLTLSQAGFSPRNLSAVADSSLTLGDVLVAAYAGAVGDRTVAGTTFTIATASTGTTVAAKTLNSSTAPTSAT